MYTLPARTPLPPRHQNHHHQRYNAQRWQPPNHAFGPSNAYQQHRGHQNQGNPTPYLQRRDPRFPSTSSTTDPKAPTTLLSPDGEYTAHLLCLLAPTSRRLAKLLQSSRTARAATLETVLPEDLITRALAAQKFQHVSDGPKGGIWMVEKGNLEVVCAVVEELEGCKEERRRAKETGRGTGVEEDKVQGRWEVLGMGKGGDEGRVFLVHGCGYGPRVLEENKTVQEKGKVGVGVEKGKGRVEGLRKAEGPKKSWVGRFLEKV